MKVTARHYMQTLMKRILQQSTSLLGWMRGKRKQQHRASTISNHNINEPINIAFYQTQL